jgi:hypothetical protein
VSARTVSDEIDFAGAAAAFAAVRRVVRVRVPRLDAHAWISAGWTLVFNEGDFSSLLTWTGTGDPPLPPPRNGGA